jgi:flagellin-like hook-associated protein FlgL
MDGGGCIQQLAIQSLSIANSSSQNILSLFRN